MLVGAVVEPQKLRQLATQVVRLQSPVAVARTLNPLSMTIRGAKPVTEGLSIFSFVVKFLKRVVSISSGVTISSTFFYTAGSPAFSFDANQITGFFQQIGKNFKFGR